MKTLILIGILLTVSSRVLAAGNHPTEEIYDAMCSTGELWVLVDVQTNGTSSYPLCLRALELYFALREEYPQVEDRAFERQILATRTCYSHSPDRIP